MLSPRADQIYDATVPGQELRPGRRKAFSFQPHRSPHPWKPVPARQPMAPSPQLLARNDWRSAIRGSSATRYSGKLSTRRNLACCLLAAASKCCSIWLGDVWEIKHGANRVLTPRQPRQPSPSPKLSAGGAAKRRNPRPTYAAWVELQSSPALGNVNLDELRQRLGNNQPRRANPTPKRDDNSLLRHMRPGNSDTDSGDES